MDLNVNVFAGTGEWLRGNLHTHSDQSDGALPPTEVIARYANAGYDFLSITDHLGVGLPGVAETVTDTTQLTTTGITPILGAELEALGPRNGEIWDLLAIGLHPAFHAPTPDEPFAAAASRARAAGAFIVLPHPASTILGVPDVPSEVDAIEIQNECCEHLNDRGNAAAFYDQMITSGRHVGVVAGDDAHFFPGNTAFRSWTMVRAHERSPTAIVTALINGMYYSTQGPVIHAIETHSNRLTIDCTPAASVFLAGPGWPSRVLRNVNGQASFDLTPDEYERSAFPAVSAGLHHRRPLRITVVDHEGRRAWTNAMLLEQ